VPFSFEGDGFWSGFFLSQFLPLSSSLVLPKGREGKCEGLKKKGGGVGLDNCSLTDGLYFSNEVRLSSCNHISYAWDRIKHLTHPLVPIFFFFDRAHQDPEDTSDATMEENLELIEL